MKLLYHLMLKAVPNRNNHRAVVNLLPMLTQLPLHLLPKEDPLPIHLHRKATMLLLALIKPPFTATKTRSLHLE